jgi:hypothetical protein
VNRIGRPEELAGTTSDALPQMAGEVLTLDGGFSNSAF